MFSSAILETASPKTAPCRFATPNLTQSPAQPRNGQWLVLPQSNYFSKCQTNGLFYLKAVIFRNAKTV